ncbi:MAG: hypothetical protein WD398_15890 [Cyclobacteriaceae bacterium]
MKNQINLKYMGWVGLLCLCLACNDPIVDFGYDGGITGRILDGNGNVVPGDITNASFTVQATGERDRLPMVFRVKGDGTFANTALFPQKYVITVVGPVSGPGEIEVDLSGGRQVIQDITVVPFLSLSKPSIVGGIEGSSVTIDYTIAGNNDYTSELREVYCSTVNFPNANTGNGPYWHTRSVVLDNESGSVTIEDLVPGTKYFLRVGARANGTSAFNFSEQITFDTP